MKEDRMNYGRFSRQYKMEGAHDSGPFGGRRHVYLGDTRSEPGHEYRLQKSREYGQRGGEIGMREERYSQMYDTSNYTDQPRHEDYGLQRSAENDLNSVGYFPYAQQQQQQEGPYANRNRGYRYNMGYNPNYDNPEEGDRYRDFDSRGNHGYRHDAAYGYQDDLREFEEEYYRRHEKPNTRYYGNLGGYNR